MPKFAQEPQVPRTARIPDVITGLIIFLAINFLVAAFYFKILDI